MQILPRYIKKFKIRSWKLQTSESISLVCKLMESIIRDNVWPIFN